MDHLWAPWRLSYVTAPRTPLVEDPCFVCRGLAADVSQDRANLIALRTPASVVLLNRFPYNNGHLLVCPRRHEGRFQALTAEELLDLDHTLQRLITLLDELMRPDGYNIGINLGAAAGAGLPGHLHWHIVPRWHSDTNFMPVLADTKVIVQSLDTLHGLLQERLNGPGS
jgi:ATP adenylyltransferase